MRVFCPNCSEPINIADDLAGKTTTCPLCKAAFTAPTLFSSGPPMPSSSHGPAATSLPPASSPGPIQMSAPASPPTAGPMNNISDAPKSPLPPLPASSPVIPPQPASGSDRLSAAPSLAGNFGGPSRSFGFSISPEIIQWTAPVCLALALFLTLFSWNGAFPGGHPVYTQSPWRALIGSIYTDPVGEKVLKMNPVKPAEGQRRLESDVHANLLLLLYLPLLLGTFALATFSTLLPRLPVRVPPNLQRLVPWRMVAVAVLAAILTLLLAVQSFRGFGLENAIAARARVTAKDAQPKDHEPTPEDRTIEEITEGQLIGALSVQHTTALQVVFILQVLAIVGAVLTFLMTRRNDRPAPRFEFVW